MEQQSYAQAMEEGRKREEYLLATQQLRAASGQASNTPIFSGSGSVQGSGADSSAYMPSMFEQNGIAVPENARSAYQNATGQAWQAGTKAPTAFNSQTGQYTIAPASSPFTVGGAGQTANSSQLASDRMQQMAQAGQGVQWGNKQSEAGMIEQARSQGWSPEYMAQAMGVPVDQISGAFQNYDLGIGRDNELASKRAAGTDLNAPSSWGGFNPATAAQAPAQAQSPVQAPAPTPAPARSPFTVGGAAPAPTANLGMGGGPAAPDVQYTRPYMQSPGNGAAVMPNEYSTGQRGMQPYNPAGMPGGGEMSRPGGGGVMIMNPDGSQRPYGTPAPGGGYNPGMGNTVDRAAVMPNQYSTGQRGMQPYNPGMGAQGPNPYLNQMASGMVGQVQQNFLQQTMPQLRSGAQASGQYGGSRQGIAEGVAAGNAATGLAGQLANLYGGAYNTDQANQTQRYGTNVSAGVSMRGQDQNYNLGQGQLGLGFQNAANNYNLGLGQLDLSNQGQNQNFYTSQRGQDLQQYQIGANLYGNGVNGQIGVGQGQYNVGQQYQNAPINAINQYGQAISPYTGYGQTQTTSGQAGGGANGVIGGGLAGAQVANNMWRGSQGNTAMINGGGFSNFPAYMYQGN